jgi:SRSO17 transposase
MNRIGKKSSKLQQIGPMCPMESLGEISPWAIVALVAVGLDLLKLSGCFPVTAVKAVAVYIGGLLWLDRKQTTTRIVKWLGGVSHDKLTRLLADDHWQSSGLMLGLIKLIQKTGHPGRLIIDDTLFPRPRSKKVQGAYWDFDHSLKRNTFGHRVVVILWSDGFWKMPVAFGLWHKEGFRPKYRTKNEIARTLLRWVVVKGIRPEYVAFDNWYASKENMKLIVKELGLEFVTRLKSNCQLNYQGRKCSALKLGRRLRREKRPYRFKDLDACARSSVVQMEGLGQVGFAVVKDDLDGAGPAVYYLLSSTPRLSTREIVRRYKTRWAIEVWFEHLKQYAGGIAYQGRIQVSVEHHLVFSMLALLVMDWLRQGTNITIPETKQLLQRVVLFRSKTGKMTLGTLQPVLAEDLENIDDVKKIIRRQFNRLTPLKINDSLCA